MGTFTEHLTYAVRMAMGIPTPPVRKKGRPDPREEYQRRKEQRAELAKVISKLSEQASAKAAACAAQVKTLGDERARLAGEKGRLYEEQDVRRIQMSALEADLAGQQADLNKLLEQIGAQQNEVNALCERKRKAEEKERDLSDNWWQLLIPGYSLYLAIDYFTDEDVQHLNSLSQNIQRMEDAVGEKRKDLDELARDLQGKKSEQTELGAKVTQLEQAIGKIISCINETNRNLVQWMELQAYYNSLAAMLENENCDIEGIRRQLIDLPKQLEKIA